MHNTQQVRMTAIFFLFCLGYAAIILNLFLLQIRQATFFTELGQKQYQISITHTPKRARILDRTGKHIAINKASLSAFICPKQVNDEQKLVSFLQKHFPNAAQRFAKNKEKSFMYVQRNLTDQQIQAIELVNLDNIYIIKEPNRFYPFACLAPVVGITNIDNVGIVGIEYACNDQLQGKPTSCTIQKDARSGYFYFHKTTNLQGKEGIPFQLTIDVDMQFLVHEALQKTVEQFQAKQGSVIVMNPITGDIIVMANYPTFDPNNTQQLDINRTKNYCTAEQYELGSVIKVFAALAALEEGVVTLDEQIDCLNKLTAYVDGRKVNTIIKHGVITFSQVIERSNNIGMAKVAKRLNEKLYNHYQRVGFGQKTNVGLPGEQHGFVNPPERWSKQSVISLSYGYEITATLLQLARAFSMIAHDGQLVKPRILLTHEPPEYSQTLYSQQAINDIKMILQRTTLRGSAYRARMQGYDIMCKTGTTNLLENGIYIASKNSYTCAGIVQKDNYKRVIVTFVKEANRPRLFASQVAVPLFEQVAQKMLIHDKVI